MRIADYDVIEKIGEGGMGVVYKARHRKLDRLVALKTVRGGAGAAPEIIERFGVEARAAGRLDHPNIVPIYESGEWAGENFLAMRWIEGRTLADWMKQHDQPNPLKAAGWMSTVARAVDFAHRHGVLHRDLKPSNIIVDSEGIPHVTDFGLAKLSVEEPEMTMSMNVIGTPRYMAPEQASGKSKNLSTAADVFSLGSILYELLAGKPAFAADTLVETLRRVVSENPPPFTLSGCRRHKDLQTICLKSLEKAPKDRYDSGAALADDLDRWLANKPISARSSPVFVKVLQWTRRNPAVAALCGALVMALFAGLVGVTWQWRRAETYAGHLVNSIRDLKLEQTDRLFADDDDAMAVAHLAALLREDPRDSVAAQRIVSALTVNQNLHLAFDPLENVTQGKDSPLSFDGRHLITATEGGRKLQLLTLEHGVLNKNTSYPHDHPVRLTALNHHASLIACVTDDSDLRLWRMKSGESDLRALPECGVLSRVVFSPDARYLFVVGSKGGTVLSTSDLKTVYYEVGLIDGDWSQESSRLLVVRRDVGRVLSVDGFQPTRTTFAHENGLMTARFSPDGERIGVGYRARMAQVLNASSGEPVTPMLAMGSAVSALSFSPNGERLLTVKDDHGAQLWDARNGRPLGTLADQRRIWLDQRAFSSDDRNLAVFQRQVVRFRDPVSGKDIGYSARSNSSFRSAAFSEDGKYLVTSQLNNKVCVWRFSKRTAALTLPHTREVFDIEFNGDGSRIATAGDNTVRIWDTTTGRRISLVKHDRTALRVRFCPDNRFMATASKDGTTRIVREGQIPVVLSHPTEVKQVDFMPGGEIIATVAADGTASLWKSSTGEALTSSLDSIKGVTHVAFSADGRWIAAANDETLSVWLTDGILEGKPPQQRSIVGAAVPIIVWSPDGTRLAAGHTDGSVATWMWPEGRRLFNVDLGSGSVVHIEFLPNMNAMLVAPGTPEAYVLDAETGVPMTKQMRHNAAIMAAALAPDGTTLALGSRDGVLRIWNLQTGDALTTSIRHPHRITAVDWSPDGSKVAVSCAGKNVRIWKLPLFPGIQPPRWLPDLAEAMVGRRIAGRHFETLEPTTLKAKRGRFLQLVHRDDPYGLWLRELLDDGSRKE